MKIYLFPFSLAIRETTTILGGNILILNFVFINSFPCYSVLDLIRNRVAAKTFRYFASKFPQNPSFFFPPKKYSQNNLYDCW